MEGNYPDLNIRDFHDLSKILNPSNHGYQNQPKYTNLDIFEALCKGEFVSTSTEEHSINQESVSLCSKSYEHLSNSNFPTKRRKNVDVRNRVHATNKRDLPHAEDGDLVLELMERFYTESLEKYYGIPENERNHQDFLRLLKCQEKYFKMIEVRNKTLHNASDIEPEQFDPSKSFRIRMERPELNNKHQLDLSNVLSSTETINSGSSRNSGEIIKPKQNPLSNSPSKSVCDSILEMSNLILHVGQEHRKIVEQLVKEQRKNSYLLNTIQELENDHDATLIELNSLKSGLVDLVHRYGGEGSSLLSKLNNAISQIFHEGLDWKVRCEYLEQILAQNDVGPQLSNASFPSSDKDIELLRITTELVNLKSAYERVKEELNQLKNAAEENTIPKHNKYRTEPNPEVPHSEGQGRFGSVLRIKSRRLLSIIRTFIHRLLYWKRLKKCDLRHAKN